MSLQDLFGSDSEHSDHKDEDAEELPSTQAHLQELFGDSDEDKNSDEEHTSHAQNQHDDSDEEDGQADQEMRPVEDSDQEKNSDEDDGPPEHLQTNDSDHEMRKVDSGDDSDLERMVDDPPPGSPGAIQANEEDNDNDVMKRHGEDSDAEKMSEDDHPPPRSPVTHQDIDEEDDDDDLKRPPEDIDSESGNDDNDIEERDFVRRPQPEGLDSDSDHEVTQMETKGFGLDSDSDSDVGPPKKQSVLNQKQKDSSDDDLNFSDDDKISNNKAEHKTKDSDTDEDFADFEKSLKELDEPQEASGPVPTQQDIFGEGLSDVSDDDDTPAPQRSVGEEPSAADRQAMQEAVEDEEEEGVSIEIELPRCSMSLSKDMYFVKLPNFLSVETKPFDPNFYEDEIDEDEVLDEEGRARLKLKVENTLRWRYRKDENGDEIKESNTRIVRWSDGSLSLHLGNEIFDMFKLPIEGEQNHLFVQQGTGLQAQAVFKNKVSFRPHSTASTTHRKMTMSLAERMSKTAKIRMMPSAERDPESHLKEIEKKEDERQRAASRREANQRRMREKSHAKGLTGSYLEQDMDDEEEDGLENSLAAIKSKFKKDLKGGGSRPTSRLSDIYSDDSDDEDEGKLQSAKLDLDSDDSDEEASKPKATSSEEPKKKKKIIEDSDSDDDSS